MGNKEEGKFHKEKCEELLLFPKEIWDSLIKWKPVSNLDPYEDAPKEVRDYHNDYVKTWLKDKSRG